MPRANASVPPEAIRIEDEVWDEAFSRREPSSESRRRRLRAIEGGQSEWVSERVSERASAPGDWVSERASARPHASGTELAPATWVGSGAVPAGEPGYGDPRPARPNYGDPRPARPNTAPPARRTVKIQGRGAERNLPVPDPARRRSSRRAYERTGFRPDRLAMWAVVLGFMLVVVAIASAHG